VQAEGRCQLPVAVPLAAQQQQLSISLGKLFQSESHGLLDRTRLNLNAVHQFELLRLIREASLVSVCRAVTLARSGTPRHEVGTRLGRRGIRITVLALATLARLSLLLVVPGFAGTGFRRLPFALLLNALHLLFHLLVHHREQTGLSGLLRASLAHFGVNVSEPAAVRSALGPDVAVLLVNHVDYRSGRIADMAGDRIFFFFDDLNSDDAVANMEEWTNDPLWRGLDAVKAGHVHRVSEMMWNTGGGILCAHMMLDDIARLYGVPAP
jgi:hypothetical protein